MDFLSTGLGKDLLGIGGIDSAAGHDDDAACCLTDEGLEHGDAGLGGGGLAGCEEAVETETDKGFEGVEGIGTEVEGAMESYADGGKEVGFVKIAFSEVDILSFGGVEEAETGFLVDMAVGGEGAYHYPIGACTTGGKDIVDDDVLFGFGIEEVAASGTDEDVFADAFDLEGGVDESEAGGEAAFVKAGTEFYALGAALGGVEDGGEGAAAYF